MMETGECDAMKQEDLAMLFNKDFFPLAGCSPTHCGTLYHHVSPLLQALVLC